MTFKDLISTNLTSGFAGADITTAEIITVLGVTFLISLYVFAVYRFITVNAFYSKDYNISLVAISLVTAGIILAMQSSLVISLGMVGALSIVRFRTAIKEPLDLLFLFWSISTGIICGTGLYKIAVILAVCVTLAIALLKFIPENRTGQLMFVGFSGDLKIDDIKNAASSFGKVVSVKSINVGSTLTNAVFDVKVSDPDGMIGAVKALSGVDTVTLTSHDGEFRG